MSSPITTIDATGAFRPDFDSVLAYFKALYRSIYGQDTYLEPDCQDGQWVAFIAAAFHDQNGAILSAYNARSPQSAQGASLASLVKINGLRRKQPTYSTVDVVLIGQAGTIIANGIVGDVAGNQWALPASVTIPASGQITVTATCQTSGAVAAAAGTVTAILTTVPGWQSVANPAAATPGQPTESDAALKQRQVRSTQNPSQSLFEGLIGSLLALPGVAAVRGYENDTGYPDANGLPGSSVCLVVDGGDVAAIGQLIARKKGSAGTFGTTVQSVTDAAGVTRQIAFCRPIDVPVAYALTVRSLGGYTTAVDTRVKQAISDWTNGLGIGMGVNRDEAALPAKLNGDPTARGYKVLSLAVSRGGTAPAPADVPIAFNERPRCTPAAVTISIAP